CPPYDGGVCCASFQLKLRRQAVFGGERSELVPGAVFHVDAALGSLLRAHVLDFAGIEYARTAGGGRRGFEIACEIRHPLFELGERPERCHVEHRHEATVVVPAARPDPETQPSEQTTQHLDHRREPAALVALGAAHRQQRATLAQLRRVGGLSRPSLSTIHPVGISLPRAIARLILPAAIADVAMSRQKGPSRSDGMATAIGLVPSRASRPPNGATASSARPDPAPAIPIMPCGAAIRG